MNKLINHAYESFFQASQNNFRASTSWVQLAQRASWKIEFLCTLQFLILESIGVLYYHCHVQECYTLLARPKQQCRG